MPELQLPDMHLSPLGDRIHHERPEGRERHVYRASATCLFVQRRICIFGQARSDFSRDVASMARASASSSAVRSNAGTRAYWATVNADSDSCSSSSSRRAEAGAMSGSALSALVICAVVMPPDTVAA